MDDHVCYCKFCEESQYYDFADISAFALHRNFYGYFRSQICRLMSVLMSFRIYLMMLFLKPLLTKDYTEGLRRSTLKRPKLNCWKISGWILVNGYGFKLHLVIDINGIMLLYCLGMRAIFVLSMKNFKDLWHIRKSPQ